LHGVKENVLLDQQRKRMDRLQNLTEGRKQEGLKKIKIKPFKNPMVGATQRRNVCEKELKMAGRQRGG